VIFQHSGERRPHIAGIAETVQQDDSRAMASDPDVKVCAVGRDLLGAKARGERF
jgi:hypothetical protein